MARAFASIAFTPTVRAAQVRMGSRDAYRAAEAGETESAALGAGEIAFIRARDSFYQGSVGENGWPYVQHRGGPIGFLQVLDARTLGYADFSGNRQYLSLGNLDANDRVSLFLMDYAAQRRLKIWGRARVIDEDTQPELLARLESPHYRARVERGVIIKVEAFDWNCPKHITPRFTAAEIAALAGAGAQPAAAHASSAGAMEPIGAGALELVVTGMRQLTARVRAYELRAPDHGVLPEVAAGAHLAVPVRLPQGGVVTRQYSLVTHPQRRDHYEIAVLHEPDGRGGSAAIHAAWRLGTRLALDPPANQFPLHDDARPAVLIAGGIGITPIIAMARALAARGNAFALHYSARTAADMAYRDELACAFPGQVRLYVTRGAGGARMDVASILRDPPGDAVFYVCGPGPMIAAVRAAAGALGIAGGRVRWESFE